MRCDNCGRQNDRGTRFCSNCGEALGEAPIRGDDDFRVGVGSAYGNGFRQLKANFLILLLITVVSIVITVPSSVIGSLVEEGGVVAGFLGLISVAFGILVNNPIGYGVSYSFLRAVRDEPVEVSNMFEAFYTYWNAVLAALLVGFIIIVGIIVLIVPGIYFACKLAFTPYLVIDRKMDVLDAIRESWRMTTGSAFTVFLVGLTAVPVLLAGLLAFGVGVIFSVMWIAAAFAALYHAVCLEEGVVE